MKDIDYWREGINDAIKWLLQQSEKDARVLADRLESEMSEAIRKATTPTKSDLQYRTFVNGIRQMATTPEVIMKGKGVRKPYTSTFDDPASMGGKKKCTKCGEKKERTEFSKRSASSDGLQMQCKACMKAYQKARKEKREKEGFKL